MAKKFTSICAALNFLLLLVPAASQACAVCFAGADDSVTHGFNASVLFLMSTPYLVVGSILGGLFFAYRRALRKQRAESESQTVGQLGWIQEDSAT